MPLTDSSLLEESFVFKTVSKKLDMSLDEIQAERKQLEANNKKKMMREKKRVQQQQQQKRKNNKKDDTKKNQPPPTTPSSTPLLQKKQHSGGVKKQRRGKKGQSNTSSNSGSDSSGVLNKAANIVAKRQQQQQQQQRQQHLANKKATHGADGTHKSRAEKQKDRHRQMKDEQLREYVIQVPNDVQKPRHNERKKKRPQPQQAKQTQQSQQVKQPQQPINVGNKQMQKKQKKKDHTQNSGSDNLQSTDLNKHLVQALLNNPQTNQLVVNAVLQSLAGTAASSPATNNHNKGGVRKQKKGKQRK